MMKAIHTNWTAPFYAKNTSEYYIEDFEILTTALSAMLWRKKNGSIKLMADKTAMDYYKSLGLLSLWNETELLEVDKDINPTMFWAGGKLFALKNQKAPVAVIDTDFIVWKSLDFDKINDCSVIHFEELYNDVYPPQSHFKMKKGFIWSDYDWNIPAANTAFCVFKNDLLIKKYTSEAINFMKNASSCGDYLTYMVFCEQRLLPMCAKANGFNISPFSNQNDLFSSDNCCFTHTWGMKQQMRDMPSLRYDFCIRCINRLVNEFPQLENILKQIDCLKKYFK